MEIARTRLEEGYYETSLISRIPLPIRESEKPEKYKIDLEEVFSRLAQIRSHSVKGQQKMADLLGISLATYSRMEGGKVNITIERFEEILATMLVPIEAFFCPEVHFWLLTELYDKQEWIDIHKNNIDHFSSPEYFESCKSYIRRQRKKSINQDLGSRLRSLRNI